MQRWRGHGWSRLSHGIHTGGGRARITVTLVSVGPYNIAGLPLSGGPGAVFSALNQLMVHAVGFCVDGKTIRSQRPSVITLKRASVSYNLSLQIRPTIK